MVVMMASALARADLGVAADRMRNCMVFFGGGEVNNGLKWVKSTGTHELGFLTSSH